MKRLGEVAVIGLAILAANAALAQSYYCIRPGAPLIPYGFSDRFEREAAEQEIADYADRMQEYLDCLAAEREDAEREAHDVIDQWNQAIGAGWNR